MQSRVALFWKVLFFITLLSLLFGISGVIARPGLDFLLTALSALQSGLFWQLCKRGHRSIRFSRAMETWGLLLNLTLGALLGRFLLAAFASDQSLANDSPMADGYISMLLLGGTAMLVSIRAAVIPSSPRRTAFLTAAVGVPGILVSAFVVPSGTGTLALRPLPSAVFPWLPMSTSVMWLFAVISCVIISKVIYGLRAEVREALELGQYTLERKLGEGGMGEVYRAHHGMMRRPTAIKLLRSELAGDDSIRRFEREVQQTARLTHPNTITIFDYGRTDDGVFYYAMELLDGATLEHIVSQTGKLPPGRVVKILSTACGALIEAHEIGLIHRDIKPANIMLCSQGGELDVVKVLDFGLVKELEVTGEVELTGANTITGTPQYMAPESILRPDSVDERTDIYALGAVAYFLLTGAPVFDGDSIVEVCGKHLHEAPEPPSARGVTLSSELEALVLACLEKDPAARPESAADVRRQLEACPDDSWNADLARRWWEAHRAELEDDEDSAPAPARTIAIDRPTR